MLGAHTAATLDTSAEPEGARPVPREWARGSHGHGVGGKESGRLWGSGGSSVVGAVREPRATVSAPGDARRVGGGGLGVCDIRAERAVGDDAQAHDSDVLTRGAGGYAGAEGCTVHTREGMAPVGRARQGRVWQARAALSAAYPRRMNELLAEA
eukprot:4166555-Pleurochrysis_carterae.AAC.1